MAYGRFKCAVLHRVCSGIRYASGRRHPALPGNHNADLRMSRHTQTAEHNPAQPRSSEIQSAAYATAYVTQQMGDVPPRMGTEMQTYVCHGIQDGAETGTAIQTPYANVGHAYSPITQEAEARAAHHTCSAGLPSLKSTGLDRRRPAYRFTGLPAQAFTPIPAGTGAYLRAPVCQMRSR